MIDRAIAICMRTTFTMPHGVRFDATFIFHVIKLFVPILRIRTVARSWKIKSNAKNETSRINYGRQKREKRLRIKAKQ